MKKNVLGFYFIVVNEIYGDGLEEVQEFVFYFYVVVYDGLEEVEEVVFCFCFYVIICDGELDEKECFGILFYCVEWNIWWWIRGSERIYVLFLCGGI